MSDYLLVLHKDTPVQNNMINFNKEGQIYDINCTESPQRQEHSLSIPGFSYIRNLHNFPHPQNVNNPNPSFFTHITNKRQLPYDEHNCSKFQRLEKEAADFCAKLVAVDVLDSDQFQPIKNDVTLSATLENHNINNNGDTDEDDQEIDVGEESNSFSIGKSADLQRASSEIPNNASLEMNGSCRDSVSASDERDNATISQNLSNAERPLIASNNFVASGREGNEYPSAFESYSFSHFFVNSTEFEPKLCVSTSACAAKEKTVNPQDLIAPAVCAPSANETSECPGSNFAMVYETKHRNSNMHVDLEQPYDFQRLIENITPIDNLDLKDAGVTQGQAAMETGNLNIKHEGEPLLDDIVHNVELLHNQENDFMDELNLRNWLSSFVEQEEVAENLSNDKKIRGNVNAEKVNGATVECQEKTSHEKSVPSALLIKQESGQNFGGGSQDKTICKEFPSDSIQVGDIYADKTKNCREDTFTHRFLQCLFPDVSDISPLQKAEESLNRENNLHEGDVFANLSTASVHKDTNTEVKSTSLQHKENKPQSETDTSSIASTKTTDSHCKHHKKELLRKFSSALEKEKNNGDWNVSLVNVEQTETNVVDDTIPSTSSLTNEDRLADDCIVISDSEDSVIEFEIVHTRPKASKMKRSSKNIATNLSNSGSVQSSGIESSSGQQAESSTPTIQNTECIVLSDDDDDDYDDDDRLPQSTSSPDSPVFVNERSLSNRPDTHGVIDLSGSSRNQDDLLKENDTANEEGNSYVTGTTAVVTPFRTHPIASTDLSVMDLQRSCSFAHNSDAVSRTYSTTEGNFGRELDDNVIDLSRRSFSPFSSEFEIYRSDGGFSVLDLSGSEGKQIEEKTVTRRDSDEESSEKQMKDDTGNYSARSCPICLDSLLSGQSVSTTPCGHLFCTACIETAVNQFKKCPTCCRKVLLKRVHKIFL